MIKLLDSHGITLWKMYLESVRPERVEPFPLPDSPPLPLERASADPLQFSPERLFGSIRLLDDGDSLILYLIVAQIDADRYTALKVSTFTQFGTRLDLGFMGTNGEYIAELDNSFTLSREQIRDSVVLDETDTYTFLQIEGACSDQGNLFSEQTLYREPIGHWRAQFRIREHELTCAYRTPSVRSPAAALWIPQLELLEAAQSLSSLQEFLSESPRSERPAARERLDPKQQSAKADEAELVSYSKAKMDSEAPAYIDRKVFNKELKLHLSWYQLTRGQNGWELALESSLRGQTARIYNGEYLIFKGVLPPSLELSRYAHLDKREIEQALRLRLETGRER